MVDIIRKKKFFILFLIVIGFLCSILISFVPQNTFAAVTIDGKTYSTFKELRLGGFCYSVTPVYGGWAGNFEVAADFYCNESNTPVTVTATGCTPTVGTGGAGRTCYFHSGPSDIPDEPKGYVYSFGGIAPTITLQPIGQKVSSGTPDSNGILKISNVLPATNPMGGVIGPGGNEDGELTTVGDTGSCFDATEGWGWVLCPGINWVGKIVAELTRGITQGLSINLLIDSNGDNGIVRVWQNILPIANIALAIAFLIIIYSTATSIGLSNYSIKKMLPRLIIVAVGVNISFYICAALADVSNIIGYGASQLFGGWVADRPQEGLQNAADFFTGLVTAIALIVALLFFWAAALIGLVTIVVSIMIRQVALIVLVIISPLAIVCYLLPNTEKWFKKWLDMYVRLLMVYPIFMIAWSGIYLVISVIQTSNMDGFWKWVFTAVLNIAPIFIILPIFRMSGGLMAKITDMTSKAMQNNPVSSRLKALNEETNKNIGAKTTAAFDRMRLGKEGVAENEKLEREGNELLENRNRQALHESYKEALGNGDKGTAAAIAKQYQDQYGESIGKSGNNAWYRDNKDENFGEQYKENRQAFAANRNKNRNKFGALGYMGSRLATGEAFSQWQANNKVWRDTMAETRGEIGKGAALAADAQKNDAKRAELQKVLDDPTSTDSQRVNARSALDRLNNRPNFMMTGSTVVPAGIAATQAKENASKSFENATAEFKQTAGREAFVENARLDLQGKTTEERGKALLNTERLQGGALHSAQTQLDDVMAKSTVAQTNVETQTIDRTTATGAVEIDRANLNKEAAQGRQTQVTTDARATAINRVAAGAGTTVDQQVVDNINQAKVTEATQKELTNVIDEQSKVGGVFAASQSRMNIAQDKSTIVTTDLQTEATRQRVVEGRADTMAESERRQEEAQGAETTIKEKGKAKDGGYIDTRRKQKREQEIYQGRASAESDSQEAAEIADGHSDALEAIRVKAQKEEAVSEMEKQAQAATLDDDIAREAKQRTTANKSVTDTLRDKESELYAEAIEEGSRQDDIEVSEEKKDLFRRAAGVNADGTSISSTTDNPEDIARAKAQAQARSAKTIGAVESEAIANQKAVASRKAEQFQTRRNTDGSFYDEDEKLLRKVLELDPKVTDIDAEIKKIEIEGLHGKYAGSMALQEAMESGNTEAIIGASNYAVTTGSSGRKMVASTYKKYMADLEADYQNAAPGEAKNLARKKIIDTKQSYNGSEAFTKMQVDNPAITEHMLNQNPETTVRQVALMSGTLKQNPGDEFAANASYLEEQANVAKIYAGLSDGKTPEQIFTENSELGKMFESADALAKDLKAAALIDDSGVVNNKEVSEGLDNIQQSLAGWNLPSTVAGLKEDQRKALETTTRVIVGTKREVRGWDSRKDGGKGGPVGR